MRKLSLALPLTGLLILGTPTLAQCPPGWFVRICKGATKADQVKLSLGIPDAGLPAVTWMFWTPDMAAQLEVPHRYRFQQELWVGGEAIPQDRAVVMCVGFRDHIATQYKFDDHDDDNLDRDDTAKCDC